VDYQRTLFEGAAGASPTRLTLSKVDVIGELKQVIVLEWRALAATALQ